MPKHTNPKPAPSGTWTKITPRTSEQAATAALQRLLDRAPSPRRATYQLLGPDGERLPLPASMLDALHQVAECLAHGDAVTVVRTAQELSTQQAATILNVSRQYVVRLVDDGKIPCVRTGTHRRLQLEDVLRYKEHRDNARASALDELAALTETTAD